MTRTVNSGVTAWRRVAVVMVLPGIVAHEATHAVVAKLLGAVRVSWDSRGWRPTVVMEWPLTTSGWRIRVTHLAPTLLAPVGLLIFGSFAYVLVSVETSTINDLIIGLLAAGNAMAYALPSREDLVGGDYEW